MRRISADWPNRGSTIRSIGVASNWRPIVGTGGRVVGTRRVVHGRGLTMIDNGGNVLISRSKWSTVLLYSGKYAIKDTGPARQCP